MTLRLTCPMCGNRMRALDHQAGMRMRCPKCGEGLEVPAPLKLEKNKQVVPKAIAPSQAKQEHDKRSLSRSLSFVPLVCIPLAVIFCVGIAVVIKHFQARAPSNASVHSAASEMLRKHLLRPKLAKFSDDWTVERLGNESGGRVDYRVDGTVWCVNRGGVGSDSEWWAQVYWQRDGRKIVVEMIYLDGQAVYLSDRWGPIVKHFGRVFGNTTSDAPEEVVREIRNVMAAVEDAIKGRSLTPFVFQWPDDPGRSEPQIRLVDGEWEITGKVKWFDGRPRDELFARCKIEPVEVVKLRLGKRWLIGK